jgi:hypothetical protein
MAVKKRKVTFIELRNTPPTKRTRLTSTNKAPNSKSKGRKRKNTKANNTQQPASLISLPSELRQAILIQTSPESYHTWRGAQYLILKRELTLRKVHPDVNADIDYVEEKWMESLRKDLDESEFRGWGGLERRENGEWFVRLR